MPLLFLKQSYKEIENGCLRHRTPYKAPNEYANSLSKIIIVSLQYLWNIRPTMSIPSLQLNQSLQENLHSLFHVTTVERRNPCFLLFCFTYHVNKCNQQNGLFSQHSPRIIHPLSISSLISQAYYINDKHSYIATKIIIIINSFQNC